MPAYIAEQRKTKAAVVGTAAGVVAVIGCLLGYQFGYLVPSVNTMIEEANAADNDAKAVEAIEAETTSTLSQIKPLQDKVNFVKSVQFHNVLVPQIYRNVAKYTYRKVEYSSMAVNGDSLSINAYVQNLSDVGKFYLTLFANPDIKSVSISALPGWPNATSQTVGLPGEAPLDPNANGFPLQVSANLVLPVAAPVPPGGGGSSRWWRIWWHDGWFWLYDGRSRYAWWRWANDGRSDGWWRRSCNWFQGWRTAGC